MRLATTLLIVALLVPLGGCGDSAEETTSTPVENGDALRQEVRAAWERNPGCKPPREASRWGCSVGAYRCLGVVTDRGWSISCSKPGRSVAFTVRPG
jgi:hypothetical protein